MTDDEVGARLAARLERQAILTRDDPPTAWFLVDEAALRRRIGPPEVMAAQLGELMGYAAPLARRQRRALPWEARPPRAGPHAPGQRRSARLIAARLDAVLAQGRPQSF